MKTWKDEIRIIDQFLPTEIYGQVVDYLHNPNTTRSWGFQMSVRRKMENSLVFNHHHVKEDNEFFYSTLMNYVSQCFNFEVKPRRIYFNAHVPLSHGSFHADDGDYTALLYVPTSDVEEGYDLTWGGETQFTNSEPYPNNDTMFVSPWENRLCIFPAKVLHRGLAYLHQDHPVRYTLAFKLECVKKSYVYNLQSNSQ
jgi:hypothetical protein